MQIANKRKVDKFLKRHRHCLQKFKVFNFDPAVIVYVLVQDGFDHFRSGSFVSICNLCLFTFLTPKQSSVMPLTSFDHKFPHNCI